MTAPGDASEAICAGCDHGAHVGICEVCAACFGCMDRQCRCLEWKRDHGRSAIERMSDHEAHQDYRRWLLAHPDPRGDQPEIRPTQAGGQAMTAPGTSTPEQLLHTTAQVAAMLGLSRSKLDHDRVEYARDLAAGRPPTSMPWVKIGAGIFYRRADVLAWIEANAEPCGVRRAVGK